MAIVLLEDQAKFLVYALIQKDFHQRILFHTCAKRSFFAFFQDLDGQLPADGRESHREFRREFRRSRDSRRVSEQGREYHETREFPASPRDLV